MSAQTSTPSGATASGHVDTVESSDPSYLADFTVFPSPLRRSFPSGRPDAAPGLSVARQLWRARRQIRLVVLAACGGATWTWLLNAASPQGRLDVLAWAPFVTGVLMLIALAVRNMMGGHLLSSTAWWSLHRIPALPPKAGLEAPQPAKTSTASAESISNEVTKENDSLNESGFVPLAMYWLDPNASCSLNHFIREIDNVRAGLSAAFGQSLGKEFAHVLSLKEQDNLAIELEIWSRNDSLLWRRCLRIRRDIMSEGGTPISADELATYAGMLAGLARKLNEHAEG